MLGFMFLNMGFCKIGRRKRQTLLKCILVALAVSGVIYWFNEVWYLSDNPVREKNLDSGYMFPRDEDEQKIVNKLSNTDSNFNKENFKQNPANQQGSELTFNKRFHKSNVNMPNKLDISNKVSNQKDAAQIIAPGKTLLKSVKSLPYTFVDTFMKVTPGLGENGAAVILSADEQKLADDVFNSAAFNVYISDRIALNRSVPDPRNPLCNHVQYDTDLPTASVIIIFTNEAWSALWRTVYSVINRSPKHLLREIILVDDFSDKEYLKNNLKKYIEHHFPSTLVKVLRLDERQGLIRARLAGAKIAVGDVLVFLDSHCETNKQWLEPLLQRIKEDRKAVLCPIIDVIDDKTLEYYASNKEYFQIGGFTWSGHFTWIEVPEWEEKRRKSTVSPTRSPTMAGGLFAIERNYFWEIGSYDSGMDIWGGENLEMSFRVWLCGGSLEIVPCSHVGHIFRSFHPYVFPGNKDTHGINTVRTVEVWMDEYKKYFYMYRHDLEHIQYGDIKDRLEFKRTYNCKPFSWFLENIYPQKFIVDKDVQAYGTVRNPITNLCLDVLNRDEDKSELLGLYPCKTQPGVVMNQMFSLSNDRELRREENCAEVSEMTTKSQLPVVMTKCHGKKENQEWKHKMGGAIIHAETGKCLETVGRTTGEDVYVTDCHGGHSQIWWFEDYSGIDLNIKYRH